jgi:hypothetical protein
LLRRGTAKEVVSLEVTVDFKRMKVSATTVRESTVLKSRNRFREVDYEEASWSTLDEASALIERFCNRL